MENGLPCAHPYAAIFDRTGIVRACGIDRERVLEYLGKGVV